MKALIVYDSFFGNTEQAAHAIGTALGIPESLVVRANCVTVEHLTEVELLIVGSPTRGFMPSPETKNFIKGLAGGSLKGVKAAAFDTRMDLATIKSSFFRFVVNTGGYAASSIAKKLVKKGGDLALPPEGFLVTGEKGPLKEGEAERAAAWAKQIIKG